MILAGVFGGVVARQLSGRGPGVPAIFLGGAFVTLAAGVLSVGAAEAALAASAPVLVFLFALFLFAAALERAGALDHLARWLIGRARTARDLPAVLFVGFGVASAFLLNDALVIIGVPALLLLARRLRAPALPLLLTLAFAVTVGSALTPFGNPQNLLVSVNSGVASPAATFLRYLLLPTAVNLGLGAWYVRRLYAREMPEEAEEFARLRAEAPPLLPASGWGARLRRAPVLAIFPGTMVVMLTLDVTSVVTHRPPVPLWESALAGAVVLLLASPGRTRIARAVNWEILLLFAGLFVVVAGSFQGGVITALVSVFPIPGPSHPVPGMLAIAATSIAGSQLVSNVPWVALQVPLLAGLGYGGATPAPWMMLAATSTLAGNVTLLGAASNLIVAELAEKQGIVLSLSRFVRAGLPLAALTLVVVIGSLVVGL